MSDALFETDASIREKIAAELDRLAAEFEKSYTYRCALRFAARFVRGEDCPLGPMTRGASVPVDRTLLIRLIEGATTLDEARDRLREDLAREDQRVDWENSKADSWTAELARGQRTREDA